MATPEIVNRQKGSSHPLKPGSFYNASVTSVSRSGKISIRINSLNVSIDNVTPIGTTPVSKLKRGDSVVCTFTNEFFTDVIVFGPSTVKPDVFAEKKKFEELVTIVNNLSSRVAALESQ
jgi:hypothetical protein